ncbi:hypothetical protein BGX27_006681 [Mortierella sp. AM989]|nr:hypothetical protein BGX27_006681 [Mortierella sp. AM989]
MPPKRTPAATAADAASFFQRGKKPTTTKRIIAAKKSLETTTQEARKSNLREPTNDLPDSTSKEQKQGSENAAVDPSSQKSDGWGGLNTQVIVDEIQSDDSWESRDSDDHATKYKLFGEVASPPSIIRAKRSSSEAKAVVFIIADGIHQDDLSEEEKMLRQFDLASCYGPCLDLTRLERWERASELGLNPPQDVKDKLLAHKALNAPLFAGRV